MPGKWQFSHSARRRNSPRLYAKTFAMYHRDGHPKDNNNDGASKYRITPRQWSVQISYHAPTPHRARYDMWTLPVRDRYVNALISSRAGHLAVRQ